SPKSTEADLKKVEAETARQQQRVLSKVAKIQAKYPDVPIRYEHGKFVITPDIPKRIATVLKGAEKAFAAQRLKDHKTIQARFGTFFACSGYPDCNTTKQIGGAQTKPDQPLEEKCPQCGNHLVVKSGRFGEFTACSNYPACKYVKQKTIGVKCPECSQGEIIERRSKKGKTFYGCNRFPDCTFVAWGKPVPEKCTECGSPYMIEKWLK